MKSKSSSNYLGSWRERSPASRTSRTARRTITRPLRSRRPGTIGSVRGQKCHRGSCDASLIRITSGCAAGQCSLTSRRRKCDRIDGLSLRSKRPRQSATVRELGSCRPVFLVSCTVTGGGVNALGCDECVDFHMPWASLISQLQPPSLASGRPGIACPRYGASRDFSLLPGTGNER